MKIKHLKENIEFMKYFKNTSWLFSEKIVRMFVGVLLSIWMARYLGPNEFGLLSYAISFVGLFTSIATLGLDNIVVRELVKYESDKNYIIGTAFGLKISGSILVLIILFITTQFMIIDLFTKSLIFIIATTTLFQSFNVIDFYFQSRVLSKYSVYSNLISFLISSILKIFFILNKMPLISFVWLMLFESMLLAVSYIYFYNTNGLNLKKWQFKLSKAFNLLKDSWPLILSGIVVSIYMKIDQIMLKEIISNEAVGQYSAALKLSESWYFIPAVIVASVFPAIISAKQKSNELYYKRLQNLYDLMVWMAILIALPMTFLSNWLINILYGEAYTEAGVVLMIHIWTGVFVFMGVASSSWFVTENLQKHSFYRAFAGAIVNIVLNFILIPKFSFYGAAISTLISQIIASYLFNATNKKTLITFKLQTNAILYPLRKFGIKYD